MTILYYHNKLLMQWKGPFEVSSVAGLNDYRVKVKGEEKVYHANLLKKYFERDEATTEGTVAVIKPDDHFKEDMHSEKWKNAKLRMRRMMIMLIS